MEEMRAEDEAEKAEGRLSVLNLFGFRPLRWQLVSIIVLMAGQQLSGINAVGQAVRDGLRAPRWAGVPTRGDEPQGTSGPLASPRL